MSNGLILTILLVLLCFLLNFHFKPNIDIVIVDKYQYKILLWCNKWDYDKETTVRVYREIMKINTEK